MQRASGVLLPVSSLPSPYGIGDFGPSAYTYVDWLQEAGQRYWTILPLLIPDSLGSPFNTVSAFALNWQLISPELLVQQKLLDAKTARALQSDAKRVRHREVAQTKRRILHQAWKYFLLHASAQQRRDFAAFQKQEKDWLDDFALYMAIKETQRGRPWFRWINVYRERDFKALQKFREKQSDRIQQHAFGQWVATQQWQSLKDYANKKGVRIFGDLPFAVAHDSVDVWSHPELFYISPQGKSLQVLGVPPDSFSKTGQLWGSPAYKWKKHAATHFQWWVQRFAKASQLYDMLRLDHFRGYAANWVIPGKAKTAKGGHWEKVPGKKLFRAIQKKAQHLHCVAEDLGVITPDVIALRNALQFPGMRILEFGLSDGKRSVHHPDNYPINCVAYTGTHDLPPLKQWFHNAKRTSKMNATRYGQSDTQHIGQNLIHALLWNKAKIVIIQMQDLLALGQGSRINTPATKRNNWSWRLTSTSLSKKTARELKSLLKETRRI
ncbi:MAG: 4-alpha-glucanotransferase [Candidatus Nomurabacteria bacterium]|nr:MAG: 4-alpha-glucanotransferase [Candidatus Nomurabacteria bacterium]